MMNKIKKYLLVLSSVFLLTGTATVFAAESGRVYDDAELLEAAEIEELNTQISALETKTGWEFYMITTLDANGKTAMAYADDFIDEHTPAEDAIGVGLLIDMDNREIYISTEAEAIRYLTDARIADILDNAYGYASDEDYATCFETMLSGIENCYDQGIPANQYNYDTETGEISVYRAIDAGEITLALLLALIVAGIVFGVVVGKYRLKFGTYRYDFHSYGKVNITNKDDRFVRQTVTHRRIQDSEDGDSGRSSTHSSSSGSSHGGGGRSF